MDLAYSLQGIEMIVLSTGGKKDVPRSPDYDDTICDAARDLILDIETPPWPSDNLSDSIGAPSDGRDTPPYHAGRDSPQYHKGRESPPSHAD